MAEATSEQVLMPPRPIRVLIRPVQDFIHNSASGGIILIVATIVALFLANGPWAEQYDKLLHSYLGLTVGDFQIKETIGHWINDGLMAIFFLLVGLEIKREVLVGELSDLRAAALPIAAALGGAIVPALIYLGLNRGGIGQAGWGIPMATDIAFALGCMALLGSRVPFALKIFLTAVAIVDDLLAVLVIAFFYTSQINVQPLLFAFGILAILFLANRLHIHKLSVYLILGVLVWYGFLQSGVHATLAGVLVAMTIPSRYRINESLFMTRVQELMDDFRTARSDSSRMLTNERHQELVYAMIRAGEAVQAPLQRLEHQLHLPVMMMIIPIFALANAAVPLTMAGMEGESLNVMLGIILGLVIGKPVGIMLASLLVVKAGISHLPTGVRWPHVLGAGMLAGIGFTMSLFIAALGLDESLLNPAKMAILIASLIAGVIGLIILSSQPEPEPEADTVVETGEVVMTPSQS